MRYHRCEACDATMVAALWPSHYRSAQHRESLRRDAMTPLMFARALLLLSAALTALSFVAYVNGGYPDSLFVGAVVALVGAVLAGKR